MNNSQVTASARGPRCPDVRAGLAPKQERRDASQQDQRSLRLQQPPGISGQVGPQVFTAVQVLE